jgi:transposase
MSRSDGLIRIPDRKEMSMSSMTDQALPVTGGVDTHADAHVAAVIDHVGRVLGTESFPVNASGYAAALAWMQSHGPLEQVGVEGTGSYGAGLARHLAEQGVTVVEVIRPNRQARRRRGKSDPADAISAATAALNGQASGAPKAHDGAVESIRVLRVARQGAVKASTQAANELHHLVITAPESLRSALMPLGTDARMAKAARFQPGALSDPVAGTKQAMRSIARRHQELQTEINGIDAALDELVQQVVPSSFLAQQGIGLQVASTLLAALGDNPGRLASEASFAALCGVNPVDASSGKKQRHRLNKGGDRQANSALWRIVFTRLSHDPRTKAYVARRTHEGKTNKEVIRSLKRYVARDVYKRLVRALEPGQVPCAVTA